MCLSKHLFPHLAKMTHRLEHHSYLCDLKLIKRMQCIRSLLFTIISYWFAIQLMCVFSALFVPKDKEGDWLCKDESTRNISLLWRSGWPVLSWELVARIFLSRISRQWSRSKVNICQRVFALAARIKRWEMRWWGLCDNLRWSRYKCWTCMESFLWAVHLFLSCNKVLLFIYYTNFAL